MRRESSLYLTTELHLVCNQMYLSPNCISFILRENRDQIVFARVCTLTFLYWRHCISMRRFSRGKYFIILESLFIKTILPDVFGKFKIGSTFGNRTFYYVKNRYFTSKWWLRINLIFAARQAFHSPRPKSRKRFFRPKIRHTKRKKWQTTSVIITQKWIS